MKEKFGIREFNEKYKTDDDCLEEIFQNRYGKFRVCPHCKNATKFYKVKKRKCYACEWCGFQLYPLAGTIFHKSTTSLKLWFFAIFLFSKSKNGVSATELERHLGVTHKCAFRIATQIRKLFKTDHDRLAGQIEMDETYVGGKQRYGRKIIKKVPVVGMQQRGGNVVATVVPNTQGLTLEKVIKENIQPRSTIITDDYVGYSYIPISYKHESVNHSKYEYVRGSVTTNHIERYFRALKYLWRTHVHVSKPYLQTYVDQTSWFWNRRYQPSSSFFHEMLAEVGKQVL